MSWYSDLPKFYQNQIKAMGLDDEGMSRRRMLKAAGAAAGAAAMSGLTFGRKAMADALLNPHLPRRAGVLARLGVALGASERTFFGLAGVGEMVVATDGRGSADFELGRLIGQGVPLEQAQQQIGRTCDGPSMVNEALRLASLHRLRLPLTAAVHHLLTGERDAESTLSQLFSTENPSE